MHKDSSFEEFYFIERNNGIVKKWCGDSIVSMIGLKHCFKEIVGERDRANVPISEALDSMEEEVWWIWETVKETEDYEVLLEKHGAQGPVFTKEKGNFNEWQDFQLKAELFLWKRLTKRQVRKVAVISTTMFKNYSDEDWNGNPYNPRRLMMHYNLFNRIADVPRHKHANRYWNKNA